MNRQLLGIALLLAAFGLIISYSAGQTDMEPAARFWLRQPEWKWVIQFAYFTVGSLAAFLAYRTSFRLLEWATPWIYGLSLVLLVFTLLFGVAGGLSSNESRSYLAIGGQRLGQPAELAKIAAILMLARWFTSRREPPSTLRGLTQPVLIAAIPAALVFKQPDLGSAIVFAGILFAMMFWAGVSPRLLALLASPVVSLLLAFNTTLWSIWMVGLFCLLLWWRPFVLEAVGVYLVNSAMGVLAFVLWARLDAYQKKRILSFLNPEAYRANAAFQLIQSKVAIGSGGWFGTGLTDGPQKRTGFIPERTTDFVFAIVGEELGFVGVCVALGLFLALLVTLVKAARRASDPFASLVVFGIVGLLLTHIFENIGMTVSIMPITGIPLPFFSYGGSFTLAIFLSLGMAMRAAAEERAAGYVES